MKYSSYPVVFFFIGLLTFSFGTKAQTRVYEAFIKGHKVGEMHITREVNDESEKISVETHIVAHLIVKIRVDYESHSTYMNGKLMESDAISKTNGHTHSKTHTIWNQDHYEINSGKERKNLNVQTLLGGDLFYLEEPVSYQEVYALASGVMLKVERDGPHRYYFQHDGKKELHIYSNGELTELQLHHKLYTITFRRASS